jgi:hypothetical protein
LVLVSEGGGTLRSVAKDGETMTKKKNESKKLKPWPPGKPLPKFASHDEEETFWRSHDFDDAMNASTDQVLYEPQATRRPRMHVYRVRR